MKSAQELIDDIVKNRKEEANKIARERHVLDDLNYILKVIPEVFWESIGSHWIVANTYSTAVNGICIYHAFNDELMSQVADAFTGLDAEIKIESDDQSPQVEMRYIFPPNPELETPTLFVRIVWETQSRGSTCVMVPVETEQVTETRTKVKRYERICKSEHPEMFDEAGNYIPELVEED